MIADVPSAPARSSAAAQAASVAPVVTTSSTSRIQRPTTSRASAERGGRTANAPATLAARSDLIEVELGDRGTLAREQRCVWEPQVARGRTGDELRLVVAARPRPGGVDRDMRHELCAHAHPGPAPGDRGPERLGQPLLAAVLDGVERRADGPAERRAPVELEQRGGEVTGQPDRNPGRCLQPAIQRRNARPAQRRPFTATPDALRGQRGVQGLVRGAPQQIDHAADR